jgi:hypothetical protein
MENKVKWNVSTKVEKFESYQDYVEGNISEIKMLDGNTLLNCGVTDLWDLVVGNDNQPRVTPTTLEPFDNSHSYIGVGDNDTAPTDKTKTGLLGTTNIWYKKVDATYPIVAANKVTFKATFYGTGAPEPYNQASFTWNEWSVARGVIDPSSYGDLDNPTDIADAIHNNLNRKVEEMGTKAGAATWVITVEISLT